ncbi:hypothetical protein [Vitreimonas flagellata]|uniref:hypothetical protein n=1 Tax=Vitreimonas flagellata TaxID=2560861 RepID=UPI0010755D3D|nr:hypothetical protein [Vitreimonas flagellata]
MTRLGIIAATFLLISAPMAVAQTSRPEAPEILTDAFRCAEIEDDTQRLACYDSAVGRLRTAQTQGQIVTIDREQAESLDRESFGFSLPNLSRLLPGSNGERGGIEEIQAQVVDVSGASRERRRFVLSNGQSWDQVEAERAANVRVGDTVTIRQAALGTFMLTSSRGGAGHRVRRAS